MYVKNVVVQGVDNMITPCIGICKLEDGECIGCHRSVTDIKCWTNYNDNKRLKIMSRDLYKLLKDRDDFEHKEGVFGDEFFRKYHEDVRLLITVYDDYRLYGEFVCNLDDQKFMISGVLKNTKEFKRYKALCEQFVANYVNFYEE